MGPTQALPRAGNFFRAERRAMARFGTFLGRRAEADPGAADNQRRLVRSQRRFNCFGNIRWSMAIGFKGVPT